MSEEIVLITGTSSGIGLSTAALLAKQTNNKFKVYASMMDTDEKNQLLEKTAGCSNVVVIELDVRSEESVNDAINQILGNEGRIDVIGKISYIHKYSAAYVILILSDVVHTHDCSNDLILLKIPYSAADKESTIVKIHNHTCMDLHLQQFMSVIDSEIRSLFLSLTS
ncbi:17-beta-hydroxysteroid dehydrogenase type 1-like [Xenia sp. Carnegie-2017]|uniref:17-beta-hydroxysteroid dehydrogenase type 1-like n=1 Tax=Xenia sp. Carnegie-2017 TaxID=2897299 RepID=UPI001F03B207|nr:17-beta-hydroxysteroid dehydrogenase type 1-like [Xenia sp. Carnegie-2017]